MTECPDVELSGLRLHFGKAPLQRRVSGTDDVKPLFELHGNDGHVWMLYEDGIAIGLTGQ